MVECFTVYSDEIAGRIDPHFYKPEFIELIETFEKSKFQLKTFKEISEKITSGATPKAGGSDYTAKEEGIPFIRSGDIKEDKTINFDEVLYIKDNIHNKILKSSQLKKGDVLIAIVGATIGQVSIYDYEKEANINQAIALVRLKEEINPEYIKAFLLANAGQKELDRIKRPVARANINLDEIGSFKILLPPIEIQNRIVEIMQSAYAQKKRKEAESHQLLDSINDYVLDELGIKLPELKDDMWFVVDSEKVKDNRADAYYYQPKFKEVKKALESGGYKVFSLGDLIIELSGGATPKVDKNFYSDSSGVPFLRVQNVTKKGIDLSDTKFIKREVHEGMLRRSQLKKEDLVFTITGRIGSVAVIPEGFEGNINQHSVRFHLKEEIEDIKINPFYITHFFNTSLGHSISIRETTGGTRPALDYKALKSLKIPLPLLKIQNKIAEEVKRRMSEAEKLKTGAGKILEEAKRKVEKMILGNE